MVVNVCIKRKGQVILCIFEGRIIFFVQATILGIPEGQETFIRNTLFVLIFARTNFCAIAHFFPLSCENNSIYYAQTGTTQKITLEKLFLGEFKLKWVAKQTILVYLRENEYAKRNQTQVREIKYARKLVRIR